MFRGEAGLFIPVGVVSDSRALALLFVFAPWRLEKFLEGDAVMWGEFLMGLAS